MLSVLVGGGLCHRRKILGLVVHPVSSSWRSGQGGRVGWASSWERGPAGRRARGAQSPWCQGARTPGQDPAGLWLHGIEPSRQGTAAPRPGWGWRERSHTWRRRGWGVWETEGGGRRPEGAQRPWGGGAETQRVAGAETWLTAAGFTAWCGCQTPAEKRCCDDTSRRSGQPHERGAQKVRGRRGRRLASGANVVTKEGAHSLRHVSNRFSP